MCACNIKQVPSEHKPSTSTTSDNNMPPSNQIPSFEKSTLAKGHIRLRGKFIEEITSDSLSSRANPTDQHSISTIWIFEVEEFIGKGATFTGPTPSTNDRIQLIIPSKEAIQANVALSYIIDTYTQPEYQDTATTKFLFVKLISTLNR